MGRALRVTPGDTVYHVLNRANGRQGLFDDEGDYAAFARVLEKTKGSGIFFDEAGEWVHGRDGISHG